MTHTPPQQHAGESGGNTVIDMVPLVRRPDANIAHARSQNAPGRGGVIRGDSTNINVLVLRKPSTATVRP